MTDTDDAYTYPSRTRLTTATRRALETWVTVPVPARARLKTPVTTRQGMIKRLEKLEATYGRNGAAEAIGVKPARIRDWHRGTNPIPANLARIEAAYDQLLHHQADTPARRRNELKRLAAVGADPRAELHVQSELQVDGYYNGQTEKVRDDRPGAPLAPGVNPRAHRWVNLGAVHLGPYLRTYADRGNLGALVELDAQDVISSKTFTNDYWQRPDVELKGLTQ